MCDGLRLKQLWNMRNRRKGKNLRISVSRRAEMRIWLTWTISNPPTMLDSVVLVYRIWSADGDQIALESDVCKWLLSLEALFCNNCRTGEHWALNYP